MTSTTGWLLCCNALRDSHIGSSFLFQWVCTIMFHLRIWWANISRYPSHALSSGTATSGSVITSICCTYHRCVSLLSEKLLAEGWVNVFVAVTWFQWMQRGEDYCKHQGIRQVALLVGKPWQWQWTWQFLGICHQLHWHHPCDSPLK